jgi:hypothetical protein
MNLIYLKLSTKDKFRRILQAESYFFSGAMETPKMCEPDGFGPHVA